MSLESGQLLLRQDTTVTCPNWVDEFSNRPCVVIRIVGVGIRNLDTFGHLLQHRKAHGDLRYDVT